MQKYYDILGLKPGASKSDIRDAYRKLALKWHPDVNPENQDQAKEMFQKIVEAYNALISPGKTRRDPDVTTSREWSDKYWKDTHNPNERKQSGFSGDEFKRMYDDLFGNRQKSYKQGFTVNDFDFDRSKYGGRETTDNDIFVDFSKTLADIVNGTELRSEVSRSLLCHKCEGKALVCDACAGTRNNNCKKCGGTGQMKCDACGGTGRRHINKTVAIMISTRTTPMKIQRGDNGKLYAVLRFRGMGNQSLDFGGMPVAGDLYFRFTIDTAGHSIDVRDGDIIHSVQVSLADVLAGSVTLVSALGKRYDNVDVLPSLNKNTRIAMPGEGVKPDMDRPPGDYVFSVTVAEPDLSKLSKEDTKTLVSILRKL